MGSISLYFFPDSEARFLAVLCYLLILTIAYNRFNALAVDYQTYDAPETARPWTTWLRYHAAAATYFCLFAGLFASIYSLLHRYPALIDIAVSNNPILNTKLKSALVEIKEESSLMVPLLSLILITVGGKKIALIANCDRKIRYFFQRLGSIPIRVSYTINLMRKADIDIEESDCLEDLPDDIKMVVRSTGNRKEPRSLEGLYMRACLLQHKLKEWDKKTSRFFNFRSVYDRQYKYIESRFNKVRKRAKIYYRLRLSSQPDVSVLTQNSTEVAADQISNNFPKSIKELQSGVREELKDLLESIYTFISCAVHIEGLSERTRRKYLQEFGFRLSNKKKKIKSPINPNDLTVLTFFMIFVIPVAAVICNVICKGAVLNEAYIIFVVWSLMAVVAGLSSVVFSLIVKHALIYSDNFPWKYIRTSGNRPCCGYLISGCFAALFSVLGLTLLSYLDPKFWKIDALAIFLKMMPWGLVPAGIAIALGFLLDVKSSSSRKQRIFDIVLTAAVAVLAAIIALSISQGSFTYNVLLQGLRFVLPAAALLGISIGWVVPFRYRSQFNQKPSIVLSNVNIKDLVGHCLEEVADIASDQGVRIKTRMNSEISTLDIDKKKMKLAIRSLLLNAIESTHEGGEIAVEVGQSGAGGLSFKIRDNGIGMAEEIRQKVNELAIGSDSEPMGRLNDEDSANLIQIRSIIENHGGKFGVDSKPGEWTEASFVLPNPRIIENLEPSFQPA